MDNLDKHSEITGLNFDGENPHIAVCHKTQGFSANLRHNALLFKGTDAKVSSEIMKTLEGKVPEEVLHKMTMNNKRKDLQDAVETVLKESMNKEYIWAYVEDFSDDMVVFCFDEKAYAVSYNMSEDGAVEFTSEPVEVKRRDLYVDTETGEELIKALDWLKKEEVPEEINSDGEVNGEGSKESQTTPIKDNEEIMSEVKTEITQDDLLKSTAVQALIQKAVTDALAAKEAEITKAKVLSDTTELVKGLSFIAEDSVEAIVKSLVSQDEAIAIIKAMSAAQEKIVELEKAVVDVKAEFASQDSVEAEVEKKTVKGSPADREAQLQKAVAAELAAKKNK